MQTAGLISEMTAPRKKKLKFPAYIPDEEEEVKEEVSTNLVSETKVPRKPMKLKLPDGSLALPKVGAKIEETISDKDKMYNEIMQLTDDAVKMAEEGKDYNTLIEFYNKTILPKLNLYGAEYLYSGGASEIADELYDKIMEAHKSKEPEKKLKTDLKTELMKPENKEMLDAISSMFGGKAKKTKKSYTPEEQLKRGAKEIRNIEDFNTAVDELVESGNMSEEIGESYKKKGKRIKFKEGHYYMFRRTPKSIVLEPYKD